MNLTVNDPKTDALRLREAVLRDGRPIAAEYPLVFRAGFPGGVVVRRAGQGGASDSVVAACARLPRRLITPAASFTVGLIGSVATAPEHRGRGYGKEVLARAAGELAAEGAVMSLLWADDAGWYRDQGWIPVGTENVYVLARGLELLMPEPEGLRRATAADHAAIHRLYTTQASRVDRTEAETSALLDGPGIRTFVAQRDGEVVGYASLGRGEDLRNVVHEWAGPIEVALSLFRAQLEASPESPDGIYVMVPPGARELISFFEFTRTPGAQGILCMAQLGNVEAAARLFSEVVPSDVRVRVVDVAAQRIQLSGPQGSIILTGQEILLALCPPRGDRKVIEVIEQEVGAALTALPLQPFVWGLDSI